MCLKSQKNNTSKLQDIALDMRKDILTMVKNCGNQNGHLGGCLSAVEVLVVLYSEVMNIDTIAHSDEDWASRDRFIMSKGHAGIAMYAALKHVGLISQSMIEDTIRGKSSVLYRHPKRNIEYGIECSVGSLGMGLGYGVGLAEAFKRNGTFQKVYVMVGDGECDEGSIWESAAYAGHRSLDNLNVIIDKNGLQLDGYTRDVLSMENMAQRWQAFGFETVEVDGHNVEEIKKAFDVNHDGKPLAIIANTIKGKGLSFAEDRVEWHDNYVSEELYEQGMRELGSKDLSGIQNEAQRKFETRRINIRGQQSCETSYELESNFLEKCKTIGSKNTIGEVSLEIAGEDEKYTLIYADCANRIGIKKMQEMHPEKCYEVGISEQNQIAMAAAMAHEGFHVVAVAYAPFITARVLDQIRANMAYMKAPVCLIGLSAGLASSDLGATHTSFEDISNLRSVPNIMVTTPADVYEIAKGIEFFVNNPRPLYLRVTINTPEECIYDVDGCYDIFKSDKIIEGKDVAIVVSGSVLSDAIKSMELIKQNGINPCLFNARTIKPLSEELTKELMQYKKIVTVEEHSIIGGLGSAIAEKLVSRGYDGRVKMIGIDDVYFYADIPNNIRKKIGLTPEGIANTVISFCKDNI